MSSLAHSPCIISVGNLYSVHRKCLKSVKFQKLINGSTFPNLSIKHLTVACTNVSQWEPSPVSYAPPNDAEGKFLSSSENIFETMNSSETVDAALAHAKENTDESNQPSLQFLRWPLWILGPALLLATGMAPTLWLPVSSVFLGPNIASLLSLTGLDCIFNLGAFLFLLLADSCARPRNSNHVCRSSPPFSYQFWNIVANVMGFIIPLLMLFSSQKGFLQPLVPSISFLVLLGPYLLLLSVQIITEMLTWHWQSPVWLVTPVVYEAYRLLQLMRGLKLGAELTAPSWMLHTIRGLVCWWVLILGVQLMRVAWYSGFTARLPQQKSSVIVDESKLE